MINLTDLLLDGGKITVHQNLYGGNGSVTKIASSTPNTDTGLLLLENRNGIRPSIGMHGHPNGIAECYTVVVGSVSINNPVIDCGGSLLCQAGDQHDLHALSDFVIVEFNKFNEEDFQI